ncbi:hypothetical protein QRX60_39805 [Amycolatopsis mongoliensis]|uniref:Uncharacterized protein n=1 Tax=Amycolatopsis mongoliensis TaxID=715475 RepID=A0A9Y2JK73_9PSEU|nr:hypothetical protein [Amycolatopsis sp. 4-36]WIY00146.1 hypothetical protein QRX60_39805 [Amycolatopsis sp. 4-36]
MKLHGNLAGLARDHRLRVGDEPPVRGREANVLEDAADRRGLAADRRPGS